MNKCNGDAVISGVVVPQSLVIVQCFLGCFFSVFVIILLVCLRFLSYDCFFLLVFSLFLYNCSLRGFTLKIVKVRLGMNSNSVFRRQCLHIETVNWNKDTNMPTFNTELKF